MIGSVLANLSAAFIKRFRVTFLIFMGVVMLGALSYTTLLKREGFPVIEIPTAVVQATYFVNDPALVNEEITVQLEQALAENEDVEQISSTTDANFAVLVVQFNESVSTDDGVESIQRDIAANAQLPEGANVAYQTFNASTIDGENDLLFTLSGDDTDSLFAAAEETVEALQGNSDIGTATVVEQFREEVNPITGQPVTIQTSFNRVGIKDGSDLEFHQAVSIGVTKASDSTGTLELSEAVKSEVQELMDTESYEGIEVTYGGDLATALTSQIGSLETNVISGLLAVVVVLFLFVNWRASIVTAIFIPTVLAATFVALLLVGYTLNVLSLFAIILVLGLFVDDAIVVVEAIDYQKKQGVKGVKAVKEAIKSIGAADVSGTVTTLLVFLPMAAISGILGDFIRLIPITVIIALILSLIIALTIVPLFSHFMLIGKREDKTILDKVIHVIVYGFSDLVTATGEMIGDFVKLYLKVPVLGAVVFIAAVMSIIIGTGFAGQLKFSIFPSPKDTDEIAVSIAYPEGTTIEQAEEIAKDVEATLVDVAEDEIVTVNYFAADSQSATLNIELTDQGTRPTSSEIGDDLAIEFEDFEDASVKVAQVSAGPPVSDFPFAMQVFSDDEDILVSATDDLADFIADLDIDSTAITEVKVDNIGSFTKLDGRRYAEVKAKFADPENTNGLIEIQEAVEAEYDADALDDLGLAEDALGFDFGQESENLDSFMSAGFALMIALIAMYGLLVMQFNSFLQPLLVFMAIPFSFVGLFPGLFLTDNALSFFVMIGLTGLMGIVVNNTIMLLDFANQERDKGKGLIDAISEAVRIRFRPLVTTSVTTVAGLFPLAISDPFWESLAFTIIFGLISSTFMVVIAFPVFYAIVELIRSGRRNLQKQIAGMFSA